MREELRVNTDLYPVTIVLARYGGAYEPGSGLAFPLYEDRLPSGWAGEDLDCGEFWENTKIRLELVTPPQRPTSIFSTR